MTEMNLRFLVRLKMVYRSEQLENMAEDYCVVVPRYVLFVIMIARNK